MRDERSLGCAQVVDQALETVPEVNDGFSFTEMGPDGVFERRDYGCLDDASESVGQSTITRAIPSAKAIITVYEP